MRAQPLGSSDQLFVRDATGLVRELSAFDAFNLVFSAVLVPVGISQALGFAPAAFPGSNMLVAFLVGGLLMAFFGVVYLTLTNAMPRSGGDYVWVSRLLHPSVGFVTNVTLTFVFLTWVSFNFTTMLGYFGPAVAFIWGLDKGVIDALNTPTSQILISMLLTAAFAALMILGTKKAATFMRWMFWVVWSGMGLWFIGLVLTSQSSAMANFRAATGIAPAEIIRIAKEAGFASSGGFDWKMTAFAMIYAFQVFTGFQWTGYFAGEIKNVRRTATTSIMGGLIAAAVLYMLGTALVYRSLGTEFYNALAYLGFNAPDKIPAGIPAVLPSITKYLVLPGFIKAYIGFSFLASILWWTPTGFMLGTRNLFAWAFDRLAPEGLADVDERFHAPVKATLTVAGIIAVLNVLNVYLSLSAYLVNVIAVMSVAFIVVALAGTIFPYRRPDIFNAADPIVRRKVLGIPLVTVAGVISVISWAFVLIVALTNASFGLKIEAKAMIEAFSVPVLAAVYYLVLVAIRKRQHIDLNASFREIPPE